jgi:predicted peptidase
MKTLVAAAGLLSFALLQGCATSPTSTPSQVPAGELAKAVLDKSFTRRVVYQYFVYLPKDYGQDPAKQYPLVLFLHGAGERGTDLDRVKSWGPPKLIAAGQDFDFILVAPQCPLGQWWHVDDLEVLLDDVLARHPIDRDRLYLTGLSMGGCATWDWILRSPKTFAAAAPICGWGNPVLARYAAPETAVWAFHGDADPVIPAEGSTRMIDALKKVDRAEAKLTLYPKVGHDSWSPTYSNPELFTWLLSKRRATPGEVGAKQ